ncbi:DUF4376 domain-containing protein [Nitrosomonas aestuarii]|nr:DUF4376 domain-containing protein [Nitrosomonas aestuarii]
MVITLFTGGSYNDLANVLWDEQGDGPLPEGIVLGKMERQGDVLVELQDYTPGHLSAVLPAAKSAKVESLTASYESEIYANISHDGKTWIADKKSQETLSQVLSVGSVPEGMYWRDATGASNPMTYADLQALAATILARGLAADTNLSAKLSAVDGASTLTEVDAITY